jgi:pimeloyl-ACP methyl ester carboxylesterase
MMTTVEPVVKPISMETVRADIEFLEANWRPGPATAPADISLIDLGTGEPLVFIPIHEHLEFVYARQVRSFSTSRRVIVYRRAESRTQFVSLADRVEELRRILDALRISRTDFVAHGDAAMVLAEFALRYPERCRALVIVSLGADYRIAPHPLIWMLHELFLRLPIEHLVPRSLLCRIIMRYITHFERRAYSTENDAPPTLNELPPALIENQFRKIEHWPALYRYSVLPVIHAFDIRARVEALRMPVLLLNRWDDALAPEAKTAWLAQHLPNCVYHVIPARGRFFLYSEAERVNPLIETFLAGQGVEVSTGSRSLPGAAGSP